MVFTFANQKGGVGKTTTTVNLGVYLAMLGKKVLLIDLDPQANLSSSIGYTPETPDTINRKKTGKRNTIYDVLTGQATVNQTFLATDIDNLFLLPASIDLAGAEIELVNVMSRESALKRNIKDATRDYDYIFIDCPPSLGLLTINALVASDEIMIPVQCEYFALEGLGQLVNTINMVKSTLNKNLKIGGVILTMYDKRTKLASEVMLEVQKYFKSKVFDSIIPRNVRLSEAPSHGKPINLYDHNSPGAKAYEKLAAEFVTRYP